MSKRTKVLFIFHSCLLVFLFSYQNCAKQDSVGSDLGGFASRRPASSLPPPPIVIANALGGTVDPNCLQKTDYDACIFKKNPVAQGRAPIGNGITYLTDLSSVQTYGVKLEGLSASGLLENSTFRVIPGDPVNVGGYVPRRTTKADWKKAYANDPDHHVGQLMAYYWLNYQLIWMKSHTGVMYTEGKNIPVVFLSEKMENNAAWNGNQIIMGTFNFTGQKSEAALSAEMYVHEMGHANLDFATRGLAQEDPNLRKLPLDKPLAERKGYGCLDETGCISAINEGQADFHYFMLFPDQTALGESATNTVDGLMACPGVSRDPSKNQYVTVTLGYTSCGQNLPGEAHVMGSVYATILWDIYTTAAFKADIEKMFSLLLAEYRSSDTFPSARNKMLDIDRTFFGGKYAAVINAAFTKRGVK